MNIQLSARIKHMPLRRQKIAVRRAVQKALTRLAAHPDSPFLSAKIVSISAGKFPKLPMVVEVSVAPIVPVARINFDLPTLSK